MGNAINSKHHRDETGFWIERPLDDDMHEYAAFDILQLRTLYNFYKPTLHNYPYIREESKRYAELYKNELPPVGAWHIDHGILPQEILDRSLRIQAQYDHLGTRVCGRCCRELHQDSFACPFNKWMRGQICHTRVEAKQFIKKPARSRHAEPISFD